MISWPAATVVNRYVPRPTPGGLPCWKSGRALVNEVQPNLGQLNRHCFNSLTACLGLAPAFAALRLLLWLLLLLLRLLIGLSLAEVS